MLKLIRYSSPSLQCGAFVRYCCVMVCKSEYVCVQSPCLDSQMYGLGLGCTLPWRICAHLSASLSPPPLPPSLSLSLPLSLPLSPLPLSPPSLSPSPSLFLSLVKKLVVRYQLEGTRPLVVLQLFGDHTHPPPPPPPPPPPSNDLLVARLTYLQLPWYTLLSGR